ncbi:hypothetical protein GCM10009609_34450 [Pseudonocardia aurantiaca]
MHWCGCTRRVGPATPQPTLPDPSVPKMAEGGSGEPGLDVTPLVPAGLGARLGVPVAGLLSREPLVVAATATAAEVALAMREDRQSAAIVGTDPPGIVTAGDLQARVLAEGRPPHTPVRQVMTRPVHTVPAEAPLAIAVLLMLDEGVEHVPVVRAGRIVGVITEDDVVRRQVPSPLLVVGRVRRIATRADAAGYGADLAAAAGALLADSVDPLRITAVVASLNDALTVRLLALAEAELGPPPCRYAWLAMGSQGRMEQLLAADQDTALAYADGTGDGADPEHAAGPDVAAYYAALAAQVTDGLAGAGLPRCRRGFMATSWSYPLARWRAIFQRWRDEPDARALLDAQVFLDFRRVGGELAIDVLNRPLVAARTRPGFLAAVADAAQSFNPRLGPFGRIRTDRDGTVDLKLRGTVPAVLLGRLYGLAAGTTARGTAQRLDAAEADGLLSADARESLLDAYRVLLRIRLARQLADLAAGRPMALTVPLTELSSVALRQLRAALAELRTRQRASALSHPSAR